MKKKRDEASSVAGSANLVCLFLSVPWNRIQGTEKNKAVLSSPKRWVSIDILKAICAFLVVCIHTPFPGIVGKGVVTLARIAVPIFFMITGFFYDGIVKRNKEIAQLKKIVILMSSANLLYFLLKALLALYPGKDIINYIKESFTIKSILKFVILNESPYSDHLWYFGAILYVLIIMFLVDHYNLRKMIYTATPILLLCDLVFGKYSILLFDRVFPFLIVRNFLFVGIPYFCIGTLLFSNIEIIIKKTKNRKTIMWLGVILFSLTSLLERYLLVSNGMNAERDHYLNTTFLAVTVFVMFISFGSPINTAGQFITHIMKECSIIVYIIHPIIIKLLSETFGQIGLGVIYNAISPIIVFACSLFIFELFHKLQLALRKYKQKNVN